ncbi:MAG: hypothetical protein RLZZ123_338 [Pseudomonadota bacterium]|jgi:streptogramin lyase
MTKHQTEASKEPSKEVSFAGIDDTMAQAANPNEPQGLKRRHFMGAVLALDAAALLAACGGGGGGSSAPTHYQWVVTTLAGTGSTEFADGTGGTATFHTPRGIALDANGNVYVADLSNHRIRKITEAGVVSTLAGAGTSGATDGIGGTATFNSPSGVAVDTSGNVYVADKDNQRIRKITAAGVVSTLAGTGATGADDGTSGTATFNSPFGVAVDTSSNVYVADSDNNLIRKINSAGVVSTVAGVAGVADYLDGTAGTATFNSPLGVAVDTFGNLYVADLNNFVIRKITPAGVVSTWAGTAGSAGAVNGSAGTASFYYPTGVAADTNGAVYIADIYNHLILKINPEGVLSTLAGAGSNGYVNGTAATAKFNDPACIAIDNGGSVYVADQTNNSIRKIVRTHLG